MYLPGGRFKKVALLSVARQAGVGFLNQAEKYFRADFNGRFEHEES